MTEDDGFNTVHPPMDGRSPSGRATAAEPVVSALRDGIPIAWQPIETLPECIEALVCVTHNVPGEVNDQRPPTEVEGYVWETVQWVDWWSERHGWFSWPQLIHVPFPPTHWMPLPPPPAQGMEAEGGDSEAGSVHDSPTPQGDAPDASHNQEAG